jgi:hypothetical protein
MRFAMVYDRPAARLLPSRRRFALARLIAFARLRTSAPPQLEHDRLILAIDRDQTVSEMYGIAASMSVLTTCYVAAALPLPRAAAIALAIPLGTMTVQVLVVLIGVLTGLVTRVENRIGINSAVLMTILLLASSYVATMASPARYAAWLCLAVMLLNAIAAGILRLLRDSVRAAEERCAR